MGTLLSMVANGRSQMYQIQKAIKNIRIVAHHVYRQIRFASCLKWVVILIPVFFSSSLFSQRLSFKHYTENDGLPSSTIYAVFQDSKGLIWFATDLGVSRFDGYSFKTFTTKDGLSDNEVFNFFEDSTGRIWFLTQSGKVSYFFKGTFVNSGIDNTLKPLDSESYVSTMFEDAEGALWLCTKHDGVKKFLRSGKVQSLSTGSFPTFGMVPSANNKFIMIRRHLVNARADEALGKMIGIDSVSIAPRAIGYLKCLAFDERELYASEYSTVVVYDNSTKKVNTIFKTKEESEFVYNLTRSGSTLWICTSKGAIAATSRGAKLSPRILEDYAVTSVLRDWEGNYWFATKENGVFFSSSLAMQAYGVQDGLLTDYVTCLGRDSLGRIWFGYREKGSVSYIDGNTIKSIHISDNPQCTAHHINFFGGRCWLAASKGLCMQSGSVFKKVAGPYRDVMELPGDKLLAGTSNGLFITSRQFYEKSADNQMHLSGMDIHGPESMILYDREKTKRIYRDQRSEVWVSSEQKLYKFEADTLRVIDPAGSIIHTAVADLAELPDHTTLLATEGEGVIFLKNEQLAYRITEEQGLSSGICNAVAVDPDGTIWIATTKGLNKISGYPGELSIEYFDELDGVRANDISDVLISNNTIWMATKSGINFFPKDLSRNKVAPGMFIEQVTLRGSPLNLDGDELVLAHHENDIGISYTGLSFSANGNIIYRYKLHRDDPWRYTRNTSVYLPSLSHDSYEFIVEARGRSGLWSKPASVSFLIQKPFWRTTAFILSMIFILAAIIWMVIALYLRYQRKKIVWEHRATLSELRNLRAQMNPHFLFNALNAIKGSLLSNNVDKADDYLSKFSKLMRLILEHSDKTSITIAEELESIRHYLEIEQFRPDHHFQYHIDVSPAVDIYTSEIPAMIVQPFIENAIWHGFNNTSGNNQLLIQFSESTDGTITIVIRDNGIGRRKAAEINNRKSHKSKGIQLVKERLEILNLKKKSKIALEIRDLENEEGTGTGTMVTIKIPA